MPPTCLIPLSWVLAKELWLAGRLHRPCRPFYSALSLGKRFTDRVVSPGSSRGRPFNSAAQKALASLGSPTLHRSCSCRQVCPASPNQAAILFRRLPWAGPSTSQIVCATYSLSPGFLATAMACQASPNKPPFYSVTPYDGSPHFTDCVVPAPSSRAAINSRLLAKPRLVRQAAIIPSPPYDGSPISQMVYSRQHRSVLAI